MITQPKRPRPRTKKLLMHCPWKAPKTWYGRIAAGAGFSSLSLLSIAGAVKSYNFSTKKYDEYCKAHPKVPKQTEIKSEHLKPYYEQNASRFKDFFNVDWHAQYSGVTAGAFGGCSVALFSIARTFGRYARCAPNLCQQAIRSSISGTFYSLVMMSSTLAIKDAHIRFCQFKIAKHYRLNPNNPDPNMAREYREKHEQRFIFIENFEKSVKRMWRSFVVPK